MRSLMGMLALALGVLAPACVAAQQAAVTVAIPANQWKFFTGSGCALPGQSECKEASQNVELVIASRLWSRTEVDLPQELRDAPDLSLLAGTGEMYRVYVNGRAIGGSGDFETQRGPANGREIFAIPQELLRTGHLVVAFENLQVLAPFTWGTDPPTRIGRMGELAVERRLDTLEYLHASWVHYLCFLLVFCAALFFLLLYAMQRQSREYLWLALLLLGLSLLRLGEFETVVDVGADLWLPGAINALANMFLIVFVIEFVFALIHKPVWWPWRVVQVLYATPQLSALVLLFPLSLDTFERIEPWAQRLYLASASIQPLASLAWLVPLRQCWRSREPEAKWIGAALTFIAFEEMNRYTEQLGLPSVPQDLLLHGVYVDLRGLSFLIFSAIMVVSLTVRYRRVQGRAQSMEMEMAAARTVQQVLIPEEMPTVAGLVIESAYLPAQEVGGDFFQVMPLADGACFVVIGDVSGKGLKAAMTVSLIVGTIRTLAEYVTTAAQMLEGLNRRLYGRGDGFATCLVMRIEESGKVTMANAGHPAAYLKSAEVETESNLPLGLALEAEYGETSFTLAEGERLTLVTDGVIEATSVGKELFGFERTREVSGEAAQAIAEKAQGFGAGAPQADDITVLTVGRLVAV